MKQPKAAKKQADAVITDCTPSGILAIFGAYFGKPDYKVFDDDVRTIGR